MSTSLDPVIAGLAGFGQRPAILAIGAEGTLTWSYAELASHVEALAGGLIQAGLQRGAAVALFAPDSPAWIATALAVIRAGGAVLPVDAQLGDEVLAHVLADSDARLVFTTADSAERLARLVPALRLVLLDASEDDARNWQALRAIGEVMLPPSDAADPAALFYTSGTTGRPKGVPLTHAQLAFQLDALAATGLLTPSDRVALPLPLHHVYPFVLGLLAPLSLGLPLILPQALTGPQVLRALKEGEATVMVGVPRLYAAMLAGIEARVAARGGIASALVRGFMALSLALNRLGLDAGRVLFGHLLHARLAPQLRLLACGGAALEAELAAKLRALGWQVAIGYGLTETAPLISINPPGGHPGSVGRPLPEVAVRIAADGEIQVRGPNVFKGYRKLPDRTREAFTADGWFRTGDLGRLDAGGFLFITGRARELIVTAGGENVQPEEVETAYQRHPCIREFALLEDRGSLLGLVLPEPGAIRRAGHSDIDAAVRDAVAEVSAGLPSYQRLAEIALTRDPLPRTRLGKLRRHLLGAAWQAARAGETQPARAEPLAPEEWPEVDRALLAQHAAEQTWDWLKRRFPAKRLTPDTSLRLDLQVDSLAWLDIALDLERVVGAELGEAAIARIETVRELLREMNEAGMNKAGAGEVCAAAWDQPERVLSATDRRWLAPTGALARALAWGFVRCLEVLARPVFNLRVEGREHLPAREQVIYVANHASFLDPFIMGAAMGPARVARTRWTGYTGIAFANPVTRLLSRIARTLPVEPERGASAALALSAAAIRQGDSLAWFPEGQRSPDGRLHDFRPGVGRLLARFPLRVIPLHIGGSFAAMPTGKHWPRRTPIVIRFGAAIDPRTLAPDLTAADAPERLAQALQQAVAGLEAARLEPREEGL
ncbi:MAG: AMP-binding protein [Gammaproteobacteria bacterium]|nr:AMP-binding protein [Gammaproteobacteria bacterium]MBU1733162.1 AMP-binding protein [Gammaproteobacteria bacterium]MBU1892210.1 AMP-binding protein [Gammaproteobacteria bacterium]